MSHESPVIYERRGRRSPVLLLRGVRVGEHGFDRYDPQPTSLPNDYESHSTHTVTEPSGGAKSRPGGPVPLSQVGGVFLLTPPE